MMEFWRRYEADERSLDALFRFTKEQIQDIPYQAAIDSLMRCFISIPKILEEARAVAKEVICKNYGEKYYENRFYRYFKYSRDRIIYYK